MGAGTEEDRICEAQQVHKQCYELVKEMSDAAKETK
jgi:hypothetical protein